jgi:hypothetical protein
MTIFQWVACSLLGLFLVVEVLRLRRAALTRPQWAVRFAVWLAALVAIASPDLVTRFANAIGIGRGADVVLYLFVLAFLASAFFFYSSQVRLQRQITTLARHLAIAEARKGGTPAGEPR